MAVFPSVTPSSMDFTAPEFPVKVNFSLSGVASRRLFGNRASNASLSMNFDNVTDAVAAEFLDAWNLSRGQTDALTVPEVVFDGASLALKNYLIEGGDELSWHFAEAPQVQRVVPGISNVRIALEATRDF